MSHMIRSWSIHVCTPLLSGRWPRHAPGSGIWPRGPHSRWAGPYLTNRPTVMPGGAMPPGRGPGDRRHPTAASQCHAAATARPPRSGGSAGSRAVHWQGRSIREASKLVPPQVCARVSRNLPEYLWAAGVATVQLTDRQARWSGRSRRSAGRCPRRCRNRSARTRYEETALYLICDLCDQIMYCRATKLRRRWRRNYA